MQSVNIKMCIRHYSHYAFMHFLSHSGSANKNFLYKLKLKNKKKILLYTIHDQELHLTRTISKTETYILSTDSP